MTSAPPPRLDVKKDLPAYRARRGRVDLLEVPTMRFLQVDGRGDPNTSPEYEAALGALYPLAYRLKVRSKRELGRDYVVPPLEGLWSAEDMEAFTSRRDKDRWQWQLMLMTPEWITAADVDAVREGSAVRWEEFDEGLCVQTLHVGPYDAEGPVLEQLHEVEIPSRGLERTGRHHEIYLRDPRLAAPERLRTVLRQPVRRLHP